MPRCGSGPVAVENGALACCAACVTSWARASSRDRAARSTFCCASGVSACPLGERPKRRTWASCLSSSHGSSAASRARRQPSSSIMEPSGRGVQSIVSGRSMIFRILLFAAKTRKPAVLQKTAGLSSIRGRGGLPHPSGYSAALCFWCSAMTFSATGCGASS